MKPRHSLFFSFLLFALLLPAWSFAGREPATIIRAVDGDTLEVSLNGHPEKVRLIGVDTPEVHESEKLHRDSVRTHQDEATIKALGQRAWDFTKSLVHAGDRVQLEYGQEPRDRYHRVLAFVWLKDCGLQKGCGRLLSLNLRLKFPLLLVTSSAGTREAKFITFPVARTIVMSACPTLLSSGLSKMPFRLGVRRRGIVGSLWWNLSF